MAPHTPQSTKDAIIRDLRRTREQSRIIAARHGVSLSLVQRLARENGGLRPRQGRKYIYRNPPEVRAPGVVGEVMTEALNTYALIDLAERIGFVPETVRRVRDGALYGGLGVFLTTAQLLGYTIKLEKSPCQ